MANFDIAVDIGTTNTRIFVAGDGVVLSEPTLVAFNTKTGNKKVFAYGKNARYMLGKTPPGTSLVAPVTGGVITDAPRTTMLLKEFFKKIFAEEYFMPRMRAIVSVPIGLSVDERNLYEGVVLDAHKGIKEVILVENVMLSALGAGMPIDHAAGGIIVNIGGGTTEISALSMAKILGGCGINIGGEKIAVELIERLALKRGIRIGLASVQKLIKEVASLYDNDTSARPVDGIGVVDKALSRTRISSIDLLDVIFPQFVRIAAEIERILNYCQPDAAAELSSKGVHFVGGLSRIPGLSAFMTNKLGIKCTVPEYPEYAAVVGAGKLLANPELLQKVAGR